MGVGLVESTYSLLVKLNSIFLELFHDSYGFFFFIVYKSWWRVAFFGFF